ncbi:hypothetical protein V8E52_002482 [Russula decolorans]
MFNIHPDPNAISQFFDRNDLHIYINNKLFFGFRTGPNVTWGNLCSCMSTIVVPVGGHHYFFRPRESPSSSGDLIAYDFSSRKAFGNWKVYDFYHTIIRLLVIPCQGIFVTKKSCHGESVPRHAMTMLPIAPPKVHLKYRPRHGHLKHPRGVGICTNNVVLLVLKVRCSKAKLQNHRTLSPVIYSLIHTMTNGRLKGGRHCASTAARTTTATTITRAITKYVASTT